MEDLQGVGAVQSRLVAPVGPVFDGARARATFAVRDTSLLRASISSTLVFMHSSIVSFAQIAQ